MAFEEYIDLIIRANNSNTDYVIYCLDGLGKERINQRDFVIKSIDLMMNMQNKFLQIELKTGKKLLVNDSSMFLTKRNGEYLEYSKELYFTCQNNPNFTCGDLISFNFHRENINLELFKKVYFQASKEVDNKYSYHFSRCNYETNSYLCGKDLLWVGYAQQYLNSQKSTREFDLSLKDIEQVL